jgi:hypothetical protein
MTSRELNQTATRLDMHTRTLNQQSRQLNTTSRALHMEARQLHTEPRQLHMQSRLLQTQASNASTRTRWCTDVETITVVTFNMNCGQCHQNKMPTAVVTRDTRMQNPLTLPQNPRLPVALNLPRVPPPNVVGPALPRLPNMLPGPRRPVLVPEMWAQPPQMPNVLPPRQRPGLFDPLAPRPGPVVLSEPLLPGDMWPLLREPVGKPSDRPRVATRKELKDFALTPDRARPSEKPKLLESVVDAQAPAKKPALVEGITSADTSRPLPDEVLQAPSLPETVADHGYRRGLPGDHSLTDPSAEAIPTEPLLPARPLLTDADLLAPDLPGLPISVLLLPDMIDTPSAIEDLDQAPGLPEFTPRDPDPIARSGQGGAARPQAPRVAAENPLGAPSLPSLPPSVLGPG